MTATRAACQCNAQCNARAARQSIVFIKTISLPHAATLCDSLRSPFLVKTVFFPLFRGLLMSVKSPCIDICKFDGKTGYCVGCLRTRDECKSWKKMKDKHRHKIIEEKSKRVAMLKK
jgi:uncharacterized protein